MMKGAPAWLECVHTHQAIAKVCTFRGVWVLCTYDEEEEMWFLTDTTRDVTVGESTMFPLCEASVVLYDTWRNVL